MFYYYITTYFIYSNKYYNFYCNIHSVNQSDLSSNTVQRSEIRRAAGTSKNAPFVYISTTLQWQFDKWTKRIVLRIGDFIIIRVWLFSSWSSSMEERTESSASGSSAQSPYPPISSEEEEEINGGDSTMEEEHVMSEVHLGCPPGISGPHISHFTISLPTPPGTNYIVFALAMVTN